MAERIILKTTNGYISQWVDDFRGCLVCGSTAHRFVTFPKKNDKNSKPLLWQELYAHVPSTRRRKGDTTPHSLIDANPNCRFIIASNFNTIQTLPENDSLKRSAAAHTNQDNNTKPRWYTIFVRVANVLSPS